MDWFKVVISCASVVVALSIAYYFVIFLPHIKSEPLIAIMQTNESATTTQNQQNEATTSQDKGNVTQPDVPIKQSIYPVNGNDNEVYLTDFEFQGASAAEIKCSNQGGTTVADSIVSSPATQSLFLGNSYLGGVVYSCSISFGESSGSNFNPDGYIIDFQAQTP